MGFKRGPEIDPTETGVMAWYDSAKPMSSTDSNDFEPRNPDKIKFRSNDAIVWSAENPGCCTQQQHYGQWFWINMLTIPDKNPVTASILTLQKNNLHMKLNSSNTTGITPIHNFTSTFTLHINILEILIVNHFHRKLGKKKEDLDLLHKISTWLYYQRNTLWKISRWGAEHQLMISWHSKW
jgi:hypothetical protein